MSTEAPEQVAITPPTPENVAESLAEGDNDYHDGNDWWPSIVADGNVVHIGVTPLADDYETKLPEVRFEAHVFKVEPSPPVAVEPVELHVEDARDLTVESVGGGFDGWTVAAHERLGSGRWHSRHRLVIRNARGEHFAAEYEQGLTESQETPPWAGKKAVTFKPVQRRSKVVRVYEWVSPDAEQAATGGAS